MQDHKLILVALAVVLGLGIFVLCGVTVLGGYAFFSALATQTAVAQVTNTAVANANATASSQAATLASQNAVTATIVANAQATDAANSTVIATLHTQRTASAATFQAQATDSARVRTTATARANATATTAAASAQAALNTGAQWTPVLKESFAGDTGSWTTGSFTTTNGFQRQTIANGKYHWELRETEDLIRWVFAPARDVADFYLSVDVQQLAGPDDADYGVVLRHDSNSNYYYFVLNNAGEYHLSVHTKNGWTSLIPDTHLSAIHPGAVNHLTIVAQGAHLVFFINDRYAAQADDTHATKGGIGFVVALNPGEQGTFEFDNFELRAPSQSIPTSTLTPTPTVSALSASGCGAVQTLPDEGRFHLGSPVETPTWNQDPPTSGTHNPVWLTAGVYSTPQDLTMIVHSLEHGYIAIYYHDLSQDELNRLTNLVRADNYKIILSPYTRASARITLTAWDHELGCNALDEGAIKDFISQFRDQGPEIGAP